MDETSQGEEDGHGTLTGWSSDFEEFAPQINGHYYDQIAEEFKGSGASTQPRNVTIKQGEPDGGADRNETPLSLPACLRGLTAFALLM
jgi:hypothetical protein